MNRHGLYFFLVLVVFLPIVFLLITKLYKELTYKILPCSEVSTLFSILDEKKIVNLSVVNKQFGIIRRYDDKCKKLNEDNIKIPKRESSNMDKSIEVIANNIEKIIAFPMEVDKESLKVIKITNPDNLTSMLSDIGVALKSNMSYIINLNDFVSLYTHKSNGGEYEYAYIDKNISRNYYNAITECEGSCKDSIDFIDEIYKTYDEKWPLDIDDAKRVNDKITKINIKTNGCKYVRMNDQLLSRINNIKGEEYTLHKSRVVIDGNKPLIFLVKRCEKNNGKDNAK